MESVLIWISLALAVIIIFAVMSRPPKKRPLVVVEPFDYLITGWHLARVDGPEEKIRQLITLFLNARLETGVLDKILSSAALMPKKRFRASLISETSYETLCQQRLVEWGNNAISILISNIFDVATQIVTAGGSRLPFEKVRPSLESQAKTAAEHGFIALVVAMSTVHSDSFKDPKLIQHSYVGSIILEASVDRNRIDKLINYHRRGGLRFLSILPLGLIDWVLERINFERSGRSIERLDIVKEPLREKERLIGNADVVAHANDDLIYTALKIWSSNQPCRFLSAVDAEKLPVEIIKELP